METGNTDNMNITEDRSVGITINNAVGPNNNITQSVGSSTNLSSNSSINSTPSVTSSQGINPSLVQAFRDTNKILDMSPEENSVTTYKTLNSGLCEVLFKLPKWNPDYI